MLEFTPDLAIAYSSTLVAATVPIWIGTIVSGKQKAVRSTTRYSPTTKRKIRRNIVKVP